MTRKSAELSVGIRAQQPIWVEFRGLLLKSNHYEARASRSALFVHTERSV